MITIDSPKRYICSAFYNHTGTAFQRCFKVSTSAFHISVPNIAEMDSKEIQRPSLDCTGLAERFFISNLADLNRFLTDEVPQAKDDCDAKTVL